MAGMELPLLSTPSGSDLTPAPVVKPQNEGFAHIAEAGANLERDAGNLYYMNKMAMHDEQDAWRAKATGQTLGADATVRTEIEQKNINAQDIPNYYRQRMGELTKPILAQFPQGATRDLVQGDIDGHVAHTGPELMYHAVASQIQDTDQQAHSTLKMLADQIPTLSPDAQAKAITTGAGLIDSNHRWTADEKAMMHQQFMGQIELGHLQKFVADSPGAALMELTSKDFDAKHPNLVLVGGEAKRLELINQANAFNADAQKVATQGFRDQQLSDINALNAYKVKGQNAPPELIQAISNRHTVSPAFLAYSNPSFKPEPIGSPGDMQHFADQIPNVKDQADGFMLMSEIANHPGMNSHEKTSLSDQLRAHMSQMNTVAGQATSAARADLYNMINPPRKQFEMQSKVAQREDIAKRALQEYDSLTKGNTDPAKPIQIRDQLFKKWVTDRQKPAGPGSAPTLNIAPGMSTAAVADMIRRSGALGN